MGKNQKNKKKPKGAEKTAAKTDKKLSNKMKKELEAIGEVRTVFFVSILKLLFINLILLGQYRRYFGTN